MLTQGLVVQGFHRRDYDEHFEQFLADVGPRVASGEIRHREEVVEGLERVPDEFRRLFDGDKVGKLVAHVADPIR